LNIKWEGKRSKGGGTEAEKQGCESKGGKHVRVLRGGVGGQ